jgi:hypothetical protein
MFDTLEVTTGADAHDMQTAALRFEFVWCCRGEKKKTKKKKKKEASSC